MSYYSALSQSHGQVELFDILENSGLNFARGSIMKYVFRAGRKDPETELEDLKKARWYLEKEIARVNRA